MALVVYKYPMEQCQFRLGIPAEAKILTAELQGSSPVIWVLLDPEQENVRRDFEMLWTGEEIKSKIKEYVTTFTSNGLVYNLFEIEVSKDG